MFHCSFFGTLAQAQRGDLLLIPCLRSRGESTNHRHIYTARAYPMGTSASGFFQKMAYRSIQKCYESPYKMAYFSKSRTQQTINKDTAIEKSTYTHLFDHYLSQAEWTPRLASIMMQFGSAPCSCTFRFFRSRASLPFTRLAALVVVS